MILIADSGSTKTHWKWWNNGTTKEFYSKGINPYQETNETILASIKEIFDTISVISNTSHLFYYGAGCGTEKNIKLMEGVLQKLLPETRVEVHSDMLGAARSVCGNEEGLAAILGTGANLCYYDGRQINQLTPSLGFILGDEGSGAYLGKVLIQSILNKEAPEELIDLFQEKYKLSKEAILHAVYKENYPNRFLAGLVPFFSPELLKHPYAYHLVKESFNSFFRKHVLKYPQCSTVPLNFVGSVAYYFKHILSEVATGHGVILKNVLADPMEGILDYHLNNK